MESVILKIDGVDFSDCLVDTVKYSLEPVWAANSGRSNVTAYFMGKRVAVKRKMTYTTGMLPQARMTELCNALDKETVSATRPDPQNGLSTVTCYASPIEMGLFKLVDGKAYWTGCTFSLIER